MIRVLLLCFMFSNILFAQNSYWKRNDGPYGGTIFATVIDESTIYIAGNGGVYKSTDLGEHWSSIGLENTKVTKLTFCNNSLIAITDAGIFRMTNNDTNWSKIKSGRFQTVFSKGSLIFLGSEYEGVFRSRDCGNSWKQINNGINNKDIEKIFLTKSNILLASAAGASGSGVFRSIDFGDNWERIDPYEYAWNFQGISEVNGVLYAFDFNNYAKVYKSTDDGLTWFLPSNATAPSDIINSIYADEGIIYVGVYHNGFFKSTNEGISWQKINYGLQTNTIFQITGNKTTLFLATYDGFYSSSKTKMYWYRKMKGVNELNITSMDFDKKYMFLGTDGSGLYRRKIAGKTWEKLNLGWNYEFITSILFLNNRIFVLASTWSGEFYHELFISSDNGNSWKKKNTNMDSSELETIVGNKYGIFIGSGFGVFRSTDNGNTWVKMTNGMPNNINSSSVAIYNSTVIVTNGTSDIYYSNNLGESWTKKYINDLYSGAAVFASQNGVFYLGSGSVNKLYRSNDKGITWEKLNIPLYNSSITAIITNNNNIYCGLSSKGILKSSDNGKTWQESNLGIIKKGITSFATFHNETYVGTNGSNFYKEISSNIDVISSINNFEATNRQKLKWHSSADISEYRIQLAKDSLFSNIIMDETVSDTFYVVNYLDYSTTYYWRVSTVTKYWNNYFSKTQELKISAPSSFHLYNNYPNPFNNQTNIRYDIPYRTNVKLVLYNILGQKVNTLLNETKDVGSHYYKLSSNGLPSGVYFLTINADKYFQTIKIILLK